MKVEALICPQVNFAFQQNGIPVIRELRLVNDGADNLEGLICGLRSAPDFIESKSWSVDRLAAGSEVLLADRDCTLSSGFLSGLTEAMQGAVTLSVTCAGTELARIQQTIEILAHNEWGGYGTMPELIAAFSMPNDPATDRLLGAAGDLLRQGGKPDGLNAYQTGSRMAVWEMVSAIWSAVSALDLKYAYPPKSFEQTGQKVRTPSRIFDGRIATCLDTTMLFCSALEQAGLHPLVLLKRGHAFAGAWLQPEQFTEVAVDTASTVRKRVDLKEMIVFETTLATHSRPVPFSQAVEAGRRQIDEMDDAEFVCAIDIQRARNQRIRPLALVDGTVAATTPSERSMTPAAAYEAAPDLPDFDSIAPPPEEPVPTTPKGRIDRWQRKLLDLSLRNPLLNYRARKASLALLCPHPGQLEDKLAAGQQIRVEALPRMAAERNRDDALHEQRTGELLDDQFVREGLDRGTVFVDAAKDDLDKRLTELYRKARRDLSEGGANTLFLAIGFLVWRRSERDQRKFRAPLILVPVELRRRSARAGVRLVHNGDEPRFNTTLLELLRQDFALDIKGLEAALPQDASGVDVTGIWDKIRRDTRDMPGFEVLPDVMLGTFSFAKYLMWKDLVDRTDALKKSSVVKHLIESPRDPFEGAVGFPDPERLDQDNDPADIFAPLDADSSQLSAVIASGEGKNFVMIGPPGTGKSQSISNMISHNLAKGRTVLFVSEKTAALNVVYRRMKAVGLGAFCLELHSNKSRKLDVLAQLRSAWESSETLSRQDWQREAGRLAGLRDDLNTYVRRLHARRRNGISIHRAIGTAVAGRDLPELRLPFTDVHAHNADDLAAIREALRQLDISADNIDGVAGHALGFVQAANWSNAWQRQALDGARALREVLGASEPALAAFADRLGLLPEALGTEQMGALAALAEALPDAAGKDLNFALEPGAAATIEAARRGGDLAVEMTRQIAGLSVPYGVKPWRRLNVERLTADWAAANATWWPKSALARGAVRKTLVSKGGATGKPDADVDLPRLSELERLDQEFRPAAEAAASVQGWADLATDVAALGRILGTAERIRATLIALAPSVDELTDLTVRLRQLIGDGNALLAPDAAVGRDCGAAQAAWAAIEAARKALGETLAADLPAGDGPCLAGLAEACTAIDRHQGILNRWCAWRRARAGCEKLGVGALADMLAAGTTQPGQSGAIFDANYCRWWAARMVDADPLLRTFVPSVHEDRIARFRHLDEEIKSLSSRYIRARICARIPDAATVRKGSEYGILRRELEKKRRHKPVRQLVSEMEGTLTTLTPCLLMSPLSVAQYLPAGLDAFDLVIFDEASQITVWDAIGAIARGRQAVVAGDPKQLPPTSFFGRADDDEDEDSDLDIGDLESILDELLGASLPARNLQWHYRSENEGLITFSNHNYYDGKLITFPSPVTEDQSVSFRHVDSPYERGAGVNPGEAREVVAEVVRRLKDPAFNAAGTTIGVVTFNAVQQNLIEDLLDTARRDDPSIEPHFDEDADESVFVKNLESVQGDERDVIFFSITFGPDKTGRVSMNFGALNRNGGERRLNVAITRARREMVVFSSLRADHIDLSRTAAQGPKDLKHFLDFADRGPRALGEAVPAPLGTFDSPFESAVAAGLEKRGWSIHSQIGVSTFRVDLGVVHPDRTGSYLLGIECDGASYHSSATARDRDKVRATILGRLGWRLLRLWSTDFWIDPDGALDRLSETITEALATERAEREAAERAQRERLEREAAALEKANLEAEAEPAAGAGRVAAPEAGDTSEKAESAPEDPAASDTYAFFVADENHDLDPDRINDGDYAPTLTALIADIIAAEGPIRQDLLTRRVTRAHGLSRSGRAIQATVDSLLPPTCPRTEEPVGTFIWPPSSNPETWRLARSPATDADQRAVDEICRQELRAFAVKHRGADDPARAIARDLGFSRLGAKAKARIEEAGGI